MNRQTWLTISLCLNALLAGVVVWAAKSRRADTAGPGVSHMITQRVVRVETRTNEAALMIREVNAPFHWRQVETTDYHNYIANLRGIDCPELTIYDIVAADVGELFKGKIKELVDSVTERFWNFRVKPDDLKQMIDEKQEELRGLRDQRDELMAALFGEKSPADKLAEAAELADKLAQNRRTLNYLSEEKLGKTLAILEQYEAARDALGQPNANLSAKERQTKFIELNAQRLRDIQAALTSQEYEEYKLRTGDSAGVRNQLVNFDGTEAEFRAVALAKMNSASDDQIRQLLGPEQFSAYQRASDNRYQQTLRITERFDLPEQTALQIYQMQKEAEAQAKKIRADKSRTDEDRQAILQAMQAESEKSIAASLGPAEFKAYKKYHGTWLERLAQDAK